MLNDGILTGIWQSCICAPSKSVTLRFLKSVAAQDLWVKLEELTDNDSEAEHVDTI